jgi:hypothetical protein
MSSIILHRQITQVLVGTHMCRLFVFHIESTTAAFGWGYQLYIASLVNLLLNSVYGLSIC